MATNQTLYSFHVQVSGPDFSLGVALDESQAQEIINQYVLPLVFKTQAPRNCTYDTNMSYKSVSPALQDVSLLTPANGERVSVQQRMKSVHI